MKCTIGYTHYKVFAYYVLKVKSVTVVNHGFDLKCFRVKGYKYSFQHYCLNVVDEIDEIDLIMYTWLQYVLSRQKQMWGLKKTRRESIENAKEQCDPSFASISKCLEIF